VIRSLTDAPDYFPGLKCIAKKGEVFMKVSRLIAAITATLIFLTLLALPNLAAPQELTSLLATAHGKGTLTLGKEYSRLALWL
jgi:hypothetical protein